MHGTPVFRGTRVPGKTLWLHRRWRDAGGLPRRIPDSSSDLAQQVLERAKQLVLSRSWWNCTLTSMLMSACGTWESRTTVRAEAAGF